VFRLKTFMILKVGWSSNSEHAKTDFLSTISDIK